MGLFPRVRNCTFTRVSIFIKSAIFLQMIPKISRWKLHAQIIYLLHPSGQFILFFSMESVDRNLASEKKLKRSVPYLVDFKFKTGDTYLYHLVIFVGWVLRFWYLLGECKKEDDTIRWCSLKDISIYSPQLIHCRLWYIWMSFVIHVS